MAAKWKCRYCGDDTGSTVQSRAKRGAVPICMKDPCWKAYWKEYADDKAKERASRARRK